MREEGEIYKPETIELKEKTETMITAPIGSKSAAGGRGQAKLLPQF